jgi:hypothetical protein
VVPLRSIEAHLGERMYSSYSFLTSALEGGEWSASRPGRAVPPDKEPPVPTVQEGGYVCWITGHNVLLTGKKTDVIQLLFTPRCQLHVTRESTSEERGKDSCLNSWRLFSRPINTLFLRMPKIYYFVRKPSIAFPGRITPLLGQYPKQDITAPCTLIIHSADSFHNSMLYNFEVRKRRSTVFSLR